MKLTNQYSITSNSLKSIKEKASIKQRISLCCFVKNEAHCIENMLTSVKDYVDEICIVDTGSIDNTIEICSKYTDRIYQVEFTDFGKIRTLTGHLAKMEWILMLDADETLSYPEMLLDLISMDKEAYALPRKRWLNWEMTNQTELEAYPDWQVRFYKNDLKHVWKRELHEYFHGGAVEHIIDKCYINHFQDITKNAKAQKQRDNLYKKLANIAQVEINGGKTIG